MMKGFSEYDPVLGDNLVLALNQAARVVPGGNVTEPNVVRQGGEERDSLPNEHRHSSDNETLNGPGAQESLNGDATVDVQVVDAPSGQLRNDLSWRPAHLFYNAPAHHGQIDRAVAQDHDALFTIRPSIKSQNRLESLSADHNDIDTGYELVVAVRFAVPLGQKVESAVRPRNETVYARADKYRCAHRRLLTLAAYYTFSC